MRPRRANGRGRSFPRGNSRVDDDRGSSPWPLTPRGRRKTLDGRYRECPMVFLVVTITKNRQARFMRKHCGNVIFSSLPADVSPFFLPRTISFCAGGKIEEPIEQRCHLPSTVLRLTAFGRRENAPNLKQKSGGHPRGIASAVLLLMWITSFCRHPPLHTPRRRHRRLSSVRRRAAPDHPEPHPPDPPARPAHRVRSPPGATAG